MRTNFTDEQIKNMTLEDAKHHIENAVYEATALFERLEYEKCATGVKQTKIRGNGHHIRQEASKLVSGLMEKRWGCGS